MQKFITVLVVLHDRAEQLRALILEVDRKREEDLYSSSRQSKDKENLMEAERSALANKMAEMSEEQSKKMLQKEIRLREDAQSKFVALERVRILIIFIF